MNTREFLPQIQRLAHYFQRAIPSEIEDRIVLETEALLNELYNTAYHDLKNSEFQELILEALSKAGSLSHSIKHGSSITPEYFRTIKVLGRTLDIIANSLD